jgi:hypothetical protein
MVHFLAVFGCGDDIGHGKGRKGGNPAGYASPARKPCNFGMA